MEGARLRMRRREERDHAFAVGAHDHLRQGCRRSGEADPAGGRRAQGPEGLEDRGPAYRAARHRGQDDRRARVRHRPQDARPAQCRDQRLPRVRRQGEERRRQGRAREARREEGRARRRFGGRGRGRHVVAREARRRRARDRLGLRTQRNGVERGVRRRPESGPRREGCGCRQREWRRPRGARGARRSVSRPCTRTRTRTTRRWSR